MGKIKNLLFGFGTLTLLLSAGYLGYALAYQNLILPNVFVAGIDLSGLDSETAELKIREVFKTNPNAITFWSEQNESLGNLGPIKVTRDYKWASDQAFKIGRTGNILTDNKDRLSLIFKKRGLSLPLIFLEDELDEAVESLAVKIESPVQWPKIVKEKESFVFVEGKNGTTVNQQEIKNEVREKLSLPGEQKVVVRIQEIKATANQEKVKQTIEKLNGWGEEPLSVKYKEFSLKLAAKDLAKFYGLIEDTIENEEFAKLVNTVSEEIEVEAKDAVFEFEDGRVKEFKPEVIGTEIDIPKFKSLFGEAITTGVERSVEVPVILSYPKVRTGDINNMGIKELIGVGKSSFSHSIPNRVFNVNLASSRINGVVVAPNEEFSFVKSVGEISRQTGYQTAYVISDGKTVLGDGGGVCQVSTTVFRAAMNFGFPITERRSHAYRVGYYEQDSPAGLDATIFSPTTDFKFLNDTGHHILVQTKVDTKNLTMRVEIYGTSDGRKSFVSKPVITGQVGAPAPSYVDDPNLAKGTTKQIDFAAAGAKVSFDYKVERGGETLFEKKFISNYQPWRAVYLVGTKE